MARPWLLPPLYSAIEEDNRFWRNLLYLLYLLHGRPVARVSAHAEVIAYVSSCEIE